MRAVEMSLLVMALAGLSACNRSSGANSKAAVQQAIEEHLKQRPNVVLQNMTVEVGDVTFSGDTAQAEVKFRSKESPSLAVGVLYKLRRTGNAWQVESTSSMSMPGTSPHGNAGASMPPSPANSSGVGPQPSH